mmetsp:Transcript_26033/g.82264  ORF Transcript_26033/g.82264 Transcript_26033/m.82264 type:complete len:595 (-) Transcript_26033:112-1896(-)
MVKKKRVEKPPAAGSAASESGCTGELAVGDVVEIHGLQGAKELNGRRGRIVAYVEETSRYGVRLEGDEDTKAVKPSNLRRPEEALGSVERAALERQLAEVIHRLKRAEDGSEERGALQKELAELIQKLKKTEDVCEAVARPGPAASEAKPKPKPAPGPKPAAPGPAAPLILQPPPPPREQHHPLQPRPKEPLREPRPEPRPVPACKPQPPRLPERPQAAVAPAGPPLYSDEHEYPDPARASRSGRVVAGALVCGIIASQAELCPATWFIWSFLAVHLVGVIFLTDYAGESGLLVLCATFGLHSGVALSEFALWTLGRDGSDSVGPWSILVFFGSLLYLHSFWMECLTLPPDYITSISLFFPMFPAFNAAIALSCAELFIEWRYFPEHKLWGTAVAAGAGCMVAGQALIAASCRTAERNFWASCRNMPEEEEKPEDFVGLEIPNRRIVQEGAYAFERHPAYLGAMLWGIGAELALCNPLMLLVVGFVLWASLLYVALEEEQELYDEFKGGYANYSALTNCWIPLFNSFLENAAFQREMSDNCEEGDDDYDEDVEEEEENCEEDIPSEDDLLPTWEGVPKGGALWNRQFREPWLLG